MHQLVGEGLGREFPPLRTSANPPPTGPEPERDDVDARIERAAASFEQRLGDHIAGTLEHALGRPPEKGQGE